MAYNYPGMFLFTCVLLIALHNAQLILRLLVGVVLLAFSALFVFLVFHIAGFA